MYVNDEDVEIISMILSSLCPQVEFEEDDLNQLDVDLSDMEGDISLDGAGRLDDGPGHLPSGESGDEDFDFDGPMVAPPGRHSQMSQGKSLHMELSEAVNRQGEGQESDHNGEDYFVKLCGLTIFVKLCCLTRFVKLCGLTR